MVHSRTRLVSTVVLPMGRVTTGCPSTYDADARNSSGRDFTG
jgi:hypothetical protein